MPSRPRTFIHTFLFVLFAALACQAQTITNISPASGVAGTQITITGQDLISTGSDLNCGVFLGSRFVIAATWTSTQIVLTIPSDLLGSTTTVPIFTDCSNHFDEFTSNVVNWTILQPIISSIYPWQGLPNTDVTIVGSGFGATQGSSTVSFKGAMAVVKSWSDIRIVVTVPLAAQTGRIVVTVPGLSPSNSLTFYVLPHIDSISPSSGTAGTVFTVSGQSLSEACPEHALFFGSLPAPIVSWTNTQIVAKVPSSLSPGVYSFPVHVDLWDEWDCNFSTGSLTFTLTTVPAPAITAVSPTSGAAGTTVTIAGSNFGATQGTSTVSFNGTLASVTSWSDTQVTATVPIGAASGPVIIVVNAATSNGQSFTILQPPSIADIQPQSGPVGTTVTITGTNFGYSQGTSTVAFNGLIAHPIAWGDSEIKVPVPSGAATGPIFVAVGSSTVQSSLFTIVTLPAITGMSPTTGPVGTEITITGTGFGQSQGTGQVWLGTTFGAVISWSDTKVVATVAPGSSSGTVQVIQGGAASNSFDFTIAAPTISSVSPESGIPGTQITITGIGFGATQDSSNVVLGTANGTVVSWSDTQIVASVTQGSMTGIAQLLVNGTLSNSVQFSVPVPHISSLTPTAGAPGTQITVVGSGFGTSQNDGSIWLGSAAGTVVSWTDTQISAIVSASSHSGTAKVQQSGLWSNVINFSVPVSGTSTNISLTPNLISMVVGETRTLQATNTSGAVQTGLSWSSSDPTLATLSTDDPPVITALAPGELAITAGDASASLTIYPGPLLPYGTVKWSAPGDGSGVVKIVPAVPSDTGVADVFAFMASGNVQAITADGTPAWTTSIGSASAVPDFQGGLVVSDAQSIRRLDGMTGASSPASYARSTPRDTPVAVHTNGNVFTVDGDKFVEIGKDGNLIAQVPLGHNTTDDGPFCWSTDTSHTDTPPNPGIDIGSPMIAGDGYAYLLYRYSTRRTTYSPYEDQYSRLCLPSVHFEVNLQLVRIGPDGNSSDLTITNLTTDSVKEVGGYENFTYSGTADPEGYVWQIGMITNGDQGILLSWITNPFYYCASTGLTGEGEPRYYCVATPMTNKLVTVSNGAISSDVSLNYGPFYRIMPMLQTEDGTFIGTAGLAYDDALVAFDQYGNFKWVKAGEYQPISANADGGSTVATRTPDGSTVTGYVNVDQFGQLSTYVTGGQTDSWFGNSYQLGSAEQVSSPPHDYANSFAAVRGGNLSSAADVQGGTYLQPVTQRVRDEIASVARGYVGSLNWRDYVDQNGVSHNQCNLFVHDVLTQSGGAFAAPVEESWKERIKYYFGIHNTTSPIYPAEAKDWANPNKTMFCWQTVSGGPDKALLGDVIAESINYTDATGHVGVVTDAQQTTSADSAAPCFPPYSPAGVIDFSDFGFRADDWVDPFKNQVTGQPCRSSGKKKNAVVKRFVCQ